MSDTTTTIDIERYAKRLTEMRDRALTAAETSGKDMAVAIYKARAAAFALALDSLFHASRGEFGEDYSSQPDPYATGQPESAGGGDR